MMSGLLFRSLCRIGFCWLAVLTTLASGGVDDPPKTDDPKRLAAQIADLKRIQDVTAKVSVMAYDGQLDEALAALDAVEADARRLAAEGLSTALGLVLQSRGLIDDDRGDDAHAARSFEELYTLLHSKRTANNYLVREIASRRDFSRQLVALNEKDRERLAPERSWFRRLRTLLDEKKSAEATESVANSLKIVDEIVGPTNFGSLVRLEALAKLHESAGDLAAASADLERARPLEEALLGKESPNLLRSLTASYRVAVRRKLPPEPAWLERAEAISLEVHGRNDRSHAEQVELTARLYEFGSDATRAKAAWDRAQDLFDDLANEALERGDHDVALPLQEKLIATRQKAFGEANWKTIDARWMRDRTRFLVQAPPEKRQLFIEGRKEQDRARAFAKQNQWPASAESYHRAAERIREALGERSALYADCLFGEAYARASQSDWPAVERLLVPCLATRIELLGTGHPNTADTAFQLGIGRASRGDHPGAIATFRQAAEIAEAALGRDSITRARSLYWQAASEWNQKDRSNAIENLDEAIRGFNAQQNRPEEEYRGAIGFAVTWQDTLATEADLAGEFARLADARRKLLDLRIKQYGQDDLRVSDARRMLATAERQEKLNPAQQAAVAHARQLREEADGLSGQGQLNDALARSRLALNELRAVLEAESSDLANAWFDLGRRHSDLSEFGAAEDAIRKSLAIRERSLPPDDPDRAVAAFQLGTISYNANRHAEARSMFQAAAIIYERGRRFADPEFGKTLNWLAWTARMTKQLPEAESEFARAAEVYQKAADLLPPSERATQRENLAQALENLAYTQALRRNYGVASTTWNRLHALWVELKGPTYWRTIDARLAAKHNAAVASLDPSRLVEFENAERLLDASGAASGIGHYPEAALAAGRAAEIIARTLGQDDLRWAVAIFTEAGAYWFAGRNDLADLGFRRAMEIRERILGPEHPDFATSLIYVASRVEGQGNHKAALEMGRRAYGVLEKTRPYWHVDRAAGELLIGRAGWPLGDPEAEKALKEAEKLFRGIAGLNPEFRRAWLVTTLSAIAEFEESRRKYTTARRAREEIWKLQAAANGEADCRTIDARLAVEHLDRMIHFTTDQISQFTEAMALKKKVATLIDDGRIADALEPARRCLELLLATVDLNHIETASAYWYLGRILHNASDLPGSLENFRRCLTIRSTILGPIHPELSGPSMWISSILYRQGQLDEAYELARFALATTRPSRSFRDADFLSATSNFSYQVEQRATTEEKSGRFARAIPWRREVLAALTEASGDDDWHARGAKDALTHAERLAALKPDGHEVLAAAARHRDRCNKLRLDNRAAEALTDALREEGLIRSWLPETDSVYLDALNNLAWRRYEEHQVERAGEAFERMVKLRTQALGLDHPDTIDARINLANFYQRTSQPGKAESILNEAKRDAQRIAGTGEIYARVLMYQGMNHRGQSQPQVALAEAREAAEATGRLSGRSSSDYADKLHDLAQVHRDLGQFDEQLAIDFKAHEILRRIVDDGRKASGGSSHVDQIRLELVCSSLFYEHDRRNEYQAAVAALRQQEEVETARLGRDHRTVLATRLRREDYEELARLGPIARLTSKAARQLARTADQLREKKLFLPSLAMDRLSLALFKMILSPAHILNQARALSMGVTLGLLGREAEKEPILLRVLDDQRLRTGGRDETFARLSSTLAGYYIATGRQDDPRVDSLMQNAADILLELGRGDDSSLATALSPVGFYFMDQGNYAMAKPLLRRADELGQRIKPNSSDALNFTPPTQIRVLLSLAEIALSMSDHGLAVNYFARGIQVARAQGEKSSTYAATLVSQAATLMKWNGLGADEPISKALEIYQNAELRESIDHATALSHSAQLASLKRDDKAARAAFKQAMDIIRPQKEQAPYGYVTILKTYAGHLAGQGALAEAQSLLDELLPRLEALYGHDHYETVDGLYIKAYVQEAKGDVAASGATLLDAWRAIHRWAERASVFQSEREQLRTSGATRLYFDAFLSTARRAKLPAESIYPAVLEWKGSVFSRQRDLAARRSLAHDPEAVRLRSELQVTARLLAVAQRGEPEEGAGSITRLVEKYDLLQAQLAALRKPEGVQTGPVSLGLAELKKALPPGVALVDYVDMDLYPAPSPDSKPPAKPTAELVAFVIRCDRPVELVRVGLTDEVTHEILRWRAWFTDSKTEEIELGTTDPAPGLRQSLWDPITPAISGSRVVLISTDSALGMFPFGALPGKAPHRYLIEEVVVGYVAVPRLLAERAHSTREVSQPLSAPRVLVVGGVNYDGAKSSPAHLLVQLVDDQPIRRFAVRGSKTTRFDYLPETITETHNALQLYANAFKNGPKPQELNGQEATEQAVREAMRGKDYVHLATHGLFDDRPSAPPPPAKSPAGSGSATDPTVPTPSSNDLAGLHPGLLTGLAFAGANHPPITPDDPLADADDGILTAVEVACLDLSGTDLVVLSACETGIGRMTGGEGLLGLQRAFQSAGAGTVVASLWSVDSAYTQELFTLFHKNLWLHRMGKLEALHQAQLSMIHKAVADGDHPRFWAAWVLNGDPGNLHTLLAAPSTSGPFMRAQMFIIAASLILLLIVIYNVRKVLTRK
jgi:CHAT domain-containing protein